MYRVNELLIGVILSCLLLTGAAYGEPSGPAPADTTAQGNFFQAAAGTTGLNLLVWTFNRFIRPGGGEGFRVGLSSWEENLTNGFEWDDNDFTTNQFGHPYQGNLYYNAARSSGFSFWESVPFAFAGSFQWEFFGETHHPSVNDWITTTVGGFALGEVLHRLGEMVFDNQATGAERTWREIGGFAIDPLNGLSRVIEGNSSRVYPNSPDRLPENYRAQMNIGVRQTADNMLMNGDSTRAVAQLLFDYGDPFFGDLNKPYDHFDLDVQLNLGDKALIGRFLSTGVLGGIIVGERENSSHILIARHHFDFANSNQFEFGVQSVGGGLLSRFHIKPGMELRTSLNLDAVILGATSSDYQTFTGRDYDYGPGASAGVSAEVLSNNHNVFSVSHEQHFIQTANGNRSQHRISISTVQATAPLHYNWSIGARYQLMLADRIYENHPEIRLRRSELSLFATLLLR
ncbi:MAG: DUF3943 domain-containing protein [Candidatus Sabulitectum sp.]|nr:DUF3943 domain-containing protein [Candidatus Sabulitectum sp.]